MTKVTHILYLSEKDGQNPFSGAENHVTTLVKELARSGDQVELIVLVWNSGPQIRARLRDLQGAGVSVVSIERDQKRAWKGRLWRAFECWGRLYLALRRRKDRIVHAHLDLIVVAIIARLADCRTVYSIHNDEPFYQKMFWRVWLRVIDRWVVAYVAITNHVRRYYVAQSGIAEKKIATIRYGVSPIAKGALTRADYGIPADCFVVGFVGRLTRQKNVHTLIEAAAQIPGLVCIVIGNGELRPDLEKLVATKGITNARFLGVVPDAARVLPLFDALCLPSRWEGLGLVLIEAMLQRVPIIASKAGAIPEILREGRYGVLFDADSVPSLVQALKFAMSNPSRMRQFAARAFVRASADFTVGEMARRTKRLYHQVLQ